MSDWSVQVTFNSENTAIEARQGQPLMGFYRVRVTGTKYMPASGDLKPKVDLYLSIIESAHDAGEVGNTFKERLNVPNAAQSDTARGWTERFLKAALVGLGHEPGAINGANGVVNLTPSMFVGREGAMHYEPYNPEDKGTQSNVVWITNEQYSRGIKGEFKVQLKNASATVSSIDAPSAITATAGFDTSLSSNGIVNLSGSTPSVTQDALTALMA